MSKSQYSYECFKTTASVLAMLFVCLLGARATAGVEKEIFPLGGFSRGVNTSFKASSNGESLDGVGKVRAIGSVSQLVILAKFKGDTPKYTAQDYYDLYTVVDFDKYGAHGSVADYFKEASFGKFVLSPGISVSDWVQLPHDQEYYIEHPQEMYADALNALPESVNLRQYDSNNDGLADMFINIIHTGHGSELTGDEKDLLSNILIPETPITKQGVTFSGFGFLPEYGKGDNITALGAIAKFALVSFGVPNLQDPYKESYGIGMWGVMGRGWRGGPADAEGSHPISPCAWTKCFLGWLTPKVLKADRIGVKLYGLTTTSGMRAYKIESGMAKKEYLLMENRQKVGFDQYLPGTGMVIYHIDDNKDASLAEEGVEPEPDNKGPHYRVQVIQADGLWNLEKKENLGDGGDPFPGSSGTTSLTPKEEAEADKPSTNSYYNAPRENVNYTEATIPPKYPTEVEIYNIQRKTAVIKFDVKINGAEILTQESGSDPAVIISEITINEGDNGTFDVVLSQEPETDVVLQVTTKDDSIVEIVAPQEVTDPADLSGKRILTFTKENWDVPQSVGVLGVQNIYAGDNTSEVYVEPVKNYTDDAYKNALKKTVLVNVISDEVAQIIVSPDRAPPAPAMTIDEKDDGTGSNTGEFNVSLRGMPETPVVISIESLNPEEVTVNIGRLTFTPLNYNVSQKITVIAIDDNYAGTDFSDIKFKVITQSSDKGYSEAQEVLERVECLDDETHGGGQSISITVDPSAFTIDESGPGNKGSFTVVLDGCPHKDVILNIENPEDDALKLSPTTLTFTSENWNDPQTVNVTALNDKLVGDRDIKLTVSVDGASDDHFLTDPPLKAYTLVTIREMDDTPGFTVTPVSLTMGENNETRTVKVVLTAGPAEGQVVIDLQPLTTEEVYVTPSQLIFDKTNWNVPQKVEITSIPDAHLGNDVETVVVSPNAGQTYSGWMINPPADQYIKVTLINDDTAGFEVNDDHISFTEGTSGVYTVRLTAQPAPGTTVTVNAMTNGLDDICMGTTANNIIKTVLTFDEFNWNIPQPVTLFGIPDQYATDDDAFVTNTIGTTSDPKFKNLASIRVDVTVLNDDTINSATIVPSVTNLTVNEVDPGRTSSFNIQLDAIPRFGNVIVVVDTLDPDEVFVHPKLDPASGTNSSPVELEFNSGNWNVPQTVFVSGYNNNYLGDGTGRIIMSIKKGSDITFVEKDDKKFVDVIIKDNDPDDKGGLSVSTTAVVVQENNGKSFFNVSLSARPRTEVTVTLTVPPVADPDKDPVIAKVVPETVVFDSTNWNIPKKITVYGDPGKKGIAITQTSVTLTPSGDQLWMDNRTPDPAPVFITVTGDTSKEYDLTPPELTVYEVDIDKNPGGPGNADINVVLNQRPAGSVTFEITSSEPSNTTIAPKTITFTPANYFKPQAVTVTSNMGNIDKDHKLKTIFKVTTAPLDPALKGLAPRIVDTLIMNINPLAKPDSISTITNKPGMGAGNEPLYIRVLENDTDPRGLPLSVKSVGVPTAGTVEITADDPDINPQVIKYTPPSSSSPNGTPFTFTYIITNGEVANSDSKPTKVSITVTSGQQVAYGSIVQLLPQDIPAGGKTPKLYGIYSDPIKDPGGAKPRNYNLKASKAGPAGGLNFEFKRAVAIYDKKALNASYKSGICFDDSHTQLTSLQFNMHAKAGSSDAELPWSLLLRPPIINAAKRYTAPAYDLDDTKSGQTTKLHAGSIIHLFGRFFGTKKPKAWLEYLDTKNRVKRAKCQVLKYAPFADAAGNLNKSIMDVNPNSQTYGESELKIRLTTHLPADWDFSKPYRIIIDNGVGLASYSGLVVTESTSDNNTPPLAQDDNFDGAGDGPKVKAGSRKNFLDVLKNDILPNCDDVVVTFDSPPSNGGKVKWDKQRCVVVYTPPKGFGAPNEQIETFTYTVREKYTDQEMSSTARVRVTVAPY